MQKKLVGMILVIFGFTGLVYARLPIKQGRDGEPIGSFGQCAEAGYPIQESSPRVCKVSGGVGYTEQVLPAPSTPMNTTKAYELIKNCQVVGIYSTHSGVVGLILKNAGYQPVNGASEADLRAHQNPTCPFTQTAME